MKTKAVLRLAAVIALTASAQELPQLRGTASNNPGTVVIQYQISKAEASPGSPYPPSAKSRISMRLTSALRDPVLNPYVKLEVMGDDDRVRDIKLLMPCLLAPGGPSCYLDSDLLFEAKLIQSADIVPCPDCVLGPVTPPVKAPVTRANAGKKAKMPKPPSQTPLTSGCVYVNNIYSHGLSIFSGVGAPEPGIEANVYNGCNQTVSVFLRFGYFDSRGEQFGDGIESMTLAAHANRQLYHVATIYGIDRGRLKIAKIISLQQFAVE